MTTVFDIGRYEVYRKLGLEKCAAIATKAPLLRRAGWWLKKKLPAGSDVRKFFIGDPKQLGRELLSGKALQKGGLIREGFRADTPLAKAMFYGLPAAETISIASGDEPDKAKRIGETLGATALGLATWKPLGMLGSMALDPVGRGLGGAVGQTAGHLFSGGQKSTSTPVEPTQGSTPTPGGQYVPGGRMLGALNQTWNGSLQNTR